MKCSKTKEAQFNKLYNENINLLYRTALIYTGDDDASQEIIVNVFLQLFIYLEKANLQQVKSWLLISTRNEAVLFAKKNHAKNGIPLDSIHLRNPKLLSSKDKILQLLFEHNAHWYQAITLVYYLDMTPNDVAEDMAITLFELEILLTNATEWIQQELSKSTNKKTKAGRS